MFPRHAQLKAAGHMAAPSSRQWALVSIAGVACMLALAGARRAGTVQPSTATLRASAQHLTLPLADGPGLPAHPAALSTATAAASITAPPSAAAARSYARQRAAADELVDVMRAAPDDWVRGSFHTGARALWVDPFRDFYRCPGVVEKLGKMGDGGKWVCGVDTLLQRSGCVVYSFGSNGDASFEKAILEHTACSVWTFDPTLNEVATAKVTAVPGLNFTAVGLSDKDGSLELRGQVRPVRTLRTLMQERGHTWIDVLKMDIEGAEWPVLNAFIEAGTPLPATQAQIEFHLRKPGDAVDTMVGLDKLGMRVFHVEENNYCKTCPGRAYELAFGHVDKHGALVTGQ
jgi:hypothetical protein